ncbi:hypothetical protein SNE40_002862 [Patella caerulea]
MAVRNSAVIAPYQFEPEYSPGEMRTDSDTDTSEDEAIDNNTRVGNTDWCLCTNCSSMPLSDECVCCKEINAVSHRLAHTTLCVIENEDFRTVCLNAEVLRVSAIARADMRGDNVQRISNDVLRHQAYRQFTYWIHQRLGRHIRKVIPSCVVAKIRTVFPSSTGHYTGFKWPE